jgi:hypothetical protein
MGDREILEIEDMDFMIHHVVVNFGIFCKHSIKNIPYYIVREVEKNV